MSHSVELTTPILSAEKVAERLGLSRQRQKLLFDLVDGRNGKMIRADRQVAGGKKASRKLAEKTR